MACHHTHVAAGLLAGTVVAAVTGGTAAEMVILGMTSAGAALLPDLDTPDSAVSHVAGRLLHFPLTILRKLARRHRGVTHTLIAGLVFALGVYFLGYVAPIAANHIPAYWPVRIVLPAVLGALAARSLLTFGAGETIKPLLSRGHRFSLSVLVAIAIGYLGAILGPTPHFALAMAMAAGAGYLSHLVADIATGGVPLIWPASPSLSERITLGHIKTNGGIDHVLGWICLVGALVLLIYASGNGSQALQLAHHLQS